MTARCGFVEYDFNAAGIGRGVDRGRRGGVLVADLYLRAQAGNRSRDGNPVDVARHEPAAQQVVVSAHYHALRCGIGGDHVQRLAGGDAQPPALAHGEMVDAGVLAQCAAIGGDDLALRPPLCSALLAADKPS